MVGKDLEGSDHEEISVRIAGVSAEIRKGHLYDKRQVHWQHTAQPDASVSEWYLLLHAVTTLRALFCNAQCCLFLPYGTSLNLESTVVNIHTTHCMSEFRFLPIIITHFPPKCY